MLLNGYSYYPHHGPAGIARRGLRPDSARAWPNPAISLFFLFRAFSPRAPRGALPGGGGNNGLPDSGFQQ